MKKIIQGDFTQLAKNYKNRVGYSLLVLKNLLAYTGINETSIIADVGAGTGKFTEELLKFNIIKKIIAVEPNDAMRKEGQTQVVDNRVEWHKGTGEKTGLEAKSIDWLTMASSFHWVEPKQGLAEFARVLKPGGYFTAIWNPRNVKASPLHTAIEAEIYRIAPNIERKSSGSGAIADQMYHILSSSSEFKDVLYVEAPYEVVMSKERYMGIWQSVNDIPAQAGPKKWAQILNKMEELISQETEIKMSYLIRSWTVRIK